MSPTKNAQKYVKTEYENNEAVEFIRKNQAECLCNFAPSTASELVRRSGTTREVLFWFDQRKSIEDRCAELPISPVK